MRIMINICNKYVDFDYSQNIEDVVAGMKQLLKNEEPIRVFKNICSIKE